MSLGLASAFVSMPAYSAEDSEDQVLLKKVSGEFQTLIAKPNAKTRIHQNGVSVSVASEYSVTFFAASGEAAYPAYVKRQLREENGKVVEDMSVVCGASKTVCDGFVNAYLEKTKRLQEAAKAKQKSKFKLK